MPCLRYLILTAAVLVFTCRACFAAEGSEERRRIPAAADLAKAQKLVKELLGDEIAQTKPAGRAALAAKILKQADESRDDAAGRYVLLCQARDMAVKAGDPVTASKAVEDLTAEYRISAGAAQEPLAALAMAPMSVDTAHLAADVLMSAADAAVAGDDIEAGVTLLKAAETVARKSRNYPLASQAKTRQGQVEKMRADSAGIKQQMEKLKDNPDDKAANLTVGRFLCMVKHDWDAALPYLAKGATGPLKDAVDKDLKAANGDESAQIAAADAWYDMAAKASADSKPCLQLRAFRWYQTAASSATGLNKAKADKRIAELQAVAESPAEKGKSKAKVWITIRTALSEQHVKRWSFSGGVFANITFEELPPTGALLIGFRYTLNNINHMPSAIQALYLTSAGEVFGKAYGTTTDPTTAPQIIKAKPGYAVGAMYLHGGGGLDFFQPIFMRIKEAELDPSDSYEGPEIGNRGNFRSKSGSDGNFMVGVRGKIDEHGRLGTFSPISLSTVSGSVFDNQGITMPSNDNNNNSNSSNNNNGTKTFIVDYTGGKSGQSHHHREMTGTSIDDVTATIRRRDRYARDISVTPKP